MAILLLKEDWNEKLVPHDPDGFITGANDAYGLVGIITVVSGIAIRAWAAGIIRKGTELCMSGPYSLIRHPLYLGSFLIAIGFCVILGDIENIIAVFIFGIAIYYPKIIGEESEMTDKYPGYSQYALVTPSVVPYRPFRYQRADWSLGQYIAHREYRLLIACILAYIIIELIADGLITWG